MRKLKLRRRLRLRRKRLFKRKYNRRRFYKKISKVVKNNKETKWKITDVLAD